MSFVRHAIFNKVTHELPIGYLISRKLALRKFYLPIGDRHLAWLGYVEILDDFIIFLLKFFNGRFNLKRALE